MSERLLPKCLDEARRLLDEPESVAIERHRFVRYADAIHDIPPAQLARVRRMVHLSRLVLATLEVWPEARLGDRERALIDFLVEEAVRKWIEEN